MGTTFVYKLVYKELAREGGRDARYFGRKSGKKSSVWRYTRCSCSGIALMAKRVVPMDSPGRQLLVSRSSEPFDLFFMLAWLLGQACLASKSLGLDGENMGGIR